MRFVVDESSWDFTGHTDDVIIQCLETFLERLETAHLREETATKSHTLYEHGDVRRSLYGLDSLTRDHRDLRVGLLKELDRLAYWDDVDEPWPDDVTIAGIVLPFAPSIAWAHTHTCRGEATACLSLSLANRRGALKVEVTGVVVSVWFVNNEAEHVGFVRDAIEVEDADENAFARLAVSAFPSLRFVDGLWSGLRSFSRSFRDVRGDLVRHLAVLSDHGQAIFEGPRDEIEARFGARGVEISPENGKVLSNKECMRARTRLYAGKDREFVWHTKLLRHVDRIHIHEGIPESDGNIIVGIFRDHLPLPGD